MHIKPAPGLRIRDHLTRALLPNEGIEIADVGGVPVHPYWQRLLRDKDVVAEPVEHEPRANAEPDHKVAEDQADHEAGVV